MPAPKNSHDAPRPAVSPVRMLVGEVKVVGTLPEGPVLLCGNHNSYRDVFLFGMIRSSARLLVHPLVFSFPFLKKYALRWGFVQVSIEDAVALLDDYLSSLSSRVEPSTTGNWNISLASFMILTATPISFLLNGG